VVEAHLEGLSFFVLICVVTEVCHIYTFADYFNRNILIDILQIFELLFHGHICHVY
jgi:hypothetical protein